MSTNIKKGPNTGSSLYLHNTISVFNPALYLKNTFSFPEQIHKNVYLHTCRCNDVKLIIMPHSRPHLCIVVAVCVSRRAVPLTCWRGLAGGRAGFSEHCGADFPG